MMDYPGLNLRNITDDQLQKQISDISIKLMKVSNKQAASQLHTILASLRSEMQERTLRKSSENDPKMKPGIVLDTEDGDKEKDDIDKLINIS